jgi:dolichol-phosphate mannosyltransferase
MKPKNIEQLIKRIDNALKDYSYEVVMVDDNSLDGTADLAEKLSQSYPGEGGKEA